jgi:hypothetical protein
MVYDKETQSVLFEVYDYDFSSGITKGMAADDFLGRATLNLDRIQMSKPTEFQMRLHDTKSGALNVICEYCPLKKNGRKKYSEGNIEGKDIIFQFSADAFTTDILEEEPTALYLSSDDESIGSDLEDDEDYSSSNHNDSSECADHPKPRKNSILHKFNPFHSEGIRTPQAKPAKQPRVSSLPHPSRKSNTTNETDEERFRRISCSSQHGKGGKASSEVGGVLCVNHMSCRNLKKSSRNMTRTLRPYIEVSVENQVKRTESKRKIKNPSFEENFNFFVVNANIGTIKFKIVNEFSMFDDVIIGQFVVDVSEVKAEGKLEKQMILDGSSDNQMFLCTLEWVEIVS